MKMIIIIPLLFIGIWAKAQETTNAFADLSIRKADAVVEGSKWHLTATAGNFGSNADSEETKVLIMLPGNVKVTEMYADRPFTTIARFTQFKGYVICDLGTLCRCNHPDARKGVCRYKATIHIKTTKDPSGRENFSVLVFNKRPDPYTEDNYWIKKPGKSDVADCGDM
jgi:hypothetical protein